MAVFASKAITASGKPLNGTYLLKMFVICLSFANLCFLNAWAEITDRGYDFLRKYSVTWQQVVAVSLDILIVAVIVWGVLYLAVSSGRQWLIRAVKWVAMAGLLLPLNVIRTDESFASMQAVYIPHALALRLSMILLGAVVGLFVLFNWQRLSSRLASSLLILFAPSMPLAVTIAAWHVWAGPSESFLPNKPLQPPLPQPAGAPHVIWIIFDEWDQALTFRDRPAGLSLPETDRFQSESFHANRVYPPARVTLLSVPSLLTGKTFVETRPQIPNEVMLTYNRTQPPVALTAQSTIFAEARRSGFNIGIAGWYIPYCRLVPECTACSWSPAIGLSGREEFEHPSSVQRFMAQTFTRQVRKIPGLYRLGVDFDGPAQKRLHAASYRHVRGDMLRTVADPRLNLVFVHMSIPHLPAIYLASGDTMSSGPATTYADNLRLVDRTIGELRRTLEESGAWDTSAILLTADHPLRVRYSEQEKIQPRLRMAEYAEVPFLLKMPGQKQGLAYNTPMQEIVTKSLLLAILNREVTTPSQVAAWLDHNPPRQ